jgi:hypothetical protein
MRNQQLTAAKETIEGMVGSKGDEGEIAAIARFFSVVNLKRSESELPYLQIISTSPCKASLSVVAYAGY